MKNRKRLLLLSIGLLTVWVAPMRSAQEDFTVWNGVVSHIAEMEVPWQELEADRDHLIAASYLTDNGPIEIHESQTEILVVQGGEGTLVAGGEILETKPVKFNQLQPSSIIAGSEIPLREGAIVRIRPNVPHQLKVIAGKHLICTTIRIGPH